MSVSPTSIPSEHGGLSYAVVVMITGAVALGSCIVSLFSAWLMNERRLNDLLAKQRRDYEAKHEELEEHVRQDYITHEQCGKCKALAAGRETGIEHGLDRLSGQMVSFKAIMEDGFQKYDKILMVLVNRSPDIAPAEKEALFP